MRVLARSAHLNRLQVMQESANNESNMTGSGSKAHEIALCASPPQDNIAGKLARMTCSAGETRLPASKPLKTPLIQELSSQPCGVMDSSTTGRKPQEQLGRAAGVDAELLQHVRGGEGARFNICKHGGGLQVRVQALVHVLTDDLIVETAPQGASMVVRLPGCKDLHICVPGFEYSCAAAKRKRKQGLLVVTVPAVAGTVTARAS